jgi:6-phosphogluconolactonase
MVANGKTSLMKNKIEILKNLEEISHSAAEKFISIGNKAIKKNGRFNVALSGGSTPKSLYNLLATDEFKGKIDWENVFFFFSDERDVSPQSIQSNFRMANESLLKPLKINRKNIIRWNTEIINAEEVAENYEKTLSKIFELSNGEFPSFDLILLGMGEDGHTASLFPFTTALNEKQKPVISTFVEKLNANRLTFTFPTINNASNIIFLISGESKAPALKEVLEGDENLEKFPSQGVNTKDGKIFWLIDKAAAGELNK